TPEAIVRMSNFLIQMEDKIGILMFAIDEAHCISSYGHDFRVSYRQLNCLKETLPDIPILAVTATATEPVIEDICKALLLDKPKIIKSSFDRPNLYLQVCRKSTSVGQELIPILKKHKKQT